MNIDSSKIITAEQKVATLAEQAANIRKTEIITRLQEIDIESVRALRATKIGRGSQADTDKLNMLEDEAEVLRIELAGL